MGTNIPEREPFRHWEGRGKKRRRSELYGRERNKGMKKASNVKACKDLNVQ
jgi:hypothetical protein